MAEHATAAQQQHHAPQQQRPGPVAAAAAEPVPFRGAPPVPVCGGHGPSPSRRTRRPPRRLLNTQGRPYGSQTAGDAQIQHGQVRELEPGHAAHKPAGARAAVGAQHRSETVREVRARALAGDGVRAALEAEALGQVDRERPGFVQKDARVGVRRGGHHVTEVAYS